uniref:PDZ domain-containing protein n=1 Tax=Sinocyclocheilus rhinocerous TaxID=307959 RepID=A0A673HXI3_9TELE
VCEEPEVLEGERPRPQGSSPGLVVSGGKDGIFIKEVKPESPASKHLSVKEGDQILSATVYFDNVSYEDALQILEHAQPYKVAFCLKRKPPPRTQEDQVPMTNVIESPKILNEAENIDSTKTGNEYTFPTLPATE